MRWSGSLKYALSTALALSVLEVVLSSSSAAGRLGGALDGIASATKYLVSAQYPLVPDRRSASSSSTTPSTPSTPTTPSPPTQTLPIVPAPITTPTPSPPKVISV